MNLCHKFIVSAFCVFVMAGILLVPNAVTAESSSKEETRSSQDNDTDTETTVDTTLLEVTPPPGWERTHQQEPGIFKGCYVYTHKNPSQGTESVGILACMIESWQGGCAKTEKDAEPGTVRRSGKAVYVTQSDTNLFICMPALDGKQEAFFAVMAEDAFRKYEARDMLAAFKNFAVPAEELVPGPDLQSYLPASFAGEEMEAQWGGLQRTYKNDGGTFEATLIVLPYFQHWGNISQCLRSITLKVGDLAPEGKAWKRVHDPDHPMYVALSRDEKALLVLRCSDENTARKYKATLDKFSW